MMRALQANRLLGVGAAKDGLTDAEVSRRRSTFGPNDIVEAVPSGFRRLVVDTVRDPMIWFLLGVGALYGSLGEHLEAVVLLASIAPLVMMDGFLHRRTQVSTRELRSLLATTASVIRDGVIRIVPARDLVPGDVMWVHPDESFAGDGIVIGGAGLQVDESALTGEALPVRKHATGEPPAREMIADEHWVSAGTRLLTGHAMVRVIFTGQETLYGGVVRSLETSTSTRTPLQHAIAHLVTILIVAAGLLCLALAWVRLRQGLGLIDAFMSAATLAVAAIPEEFPVAFTFYLGLGVYRLAKQRALVRRAVVVENIGRVTSICTDKTGTLTEGALTLTHVHPARGQSDEHVIEVAAAASRADSGDPLDRAILRTGVVPSPRIEGFVFTEDRRRETAIIARDERLIAAMKGAPEVVFEMCEFEPEADRPWRSLVIELASSGHKVIACAERELQSSELQLGEPPRGYRFVGLIGFEDPLRPGVGEAIKAARAAGIRVLMVTGDHPATARAIARELRLGGEEPNVVSLDDAEAFERATHRSDIDVIARAIPKQKLAIVRALQARGEVVAVTGDGVNDVPALKAADIGIAMGQRGTRSAREIGSVVLLDDDFGSIVRAIAEGQQLFRNLQLSFAYLIMVHIPLVGTAALIPLLGFPLLYLPIHVVWMELVIHPTALLVFQEPPPADELRALGRPRQARFFDGVSWMVIIAVSSFVTLAMLYGYQRALGDDLRVEHARAISILTLILASAAITAGLSRFATRASWIIVSTTVASAVIFLETPLASVLHVQALHLDDWLLAAGTVVIPALAALLLRRRCFSRHPLTREGDRRATASSK